MPVDEELTFWSSIMWSDVGWISSRDGRRSAMGLIYQ